MKIEEYSRDMRRYTINARVLIATGILILLALIAGCIHTFYEFTPSAQHIMAQQDAMLDRLDTMQSELTVMSEEVAQIVQIPDETIPRLAGDGT